MTGQNALNPYESPRTAVDTKRRLFNDSEPKKRSMLGIRATLAVPFAGAVLNLAPVVAHGPLRQFINRVQVRYILLPFNWKDILAFAAMSLLLLTLGVLQMWVVCRMRCQVVHVLGSAFLLLAPLAVTLPLAMHYVLDPLVGNQRDLFTGLMIGILLATVMCLMGRCLRQYAQPAQTR